jgi:signal transduction histidine kinase
VLRTLVGSVDKAAEVLAGCQANVALDCESAARARLLVEMAAVLEDAAKADARGILERGRRVRSVVLQEVLRSCIRSLRPSALAEGQTLHLIVPSVALSLEADPVGLREMLHALLANSLKHTPSGGNIHIMAGVEGATAVVRVVDDGFGMPGRRMSKVLLILAGQDRLTKLEEADIELAAMADLVTLHGGLLEARSPGMGKGSQFCLRLPIAAT